MNKKKLLITMCIIIGVLAIIFIVLYVIAINKETTNIKVTSKMDVIFEVKHNGKVKNIKKLNDSASKLKEENYKNKHISEAIPIMINKGIDLKELNKEAVSYNVYVVVLSNNPDTVGEYKKSIKTNIKKYKLSNNADILLEFQKATKEQLNQKTCSINNAC